MCWHLAVHLYCSGRRFHVQWTKLHCIGVYPFCCIVSEQGLNQIELANDLALTRIWQLFLRKPPVRTEIARRAFSQAAPTIGNDLPLDSHSAVTYERFRSATKKHFYELAFMNWSRDCLCSHDSFLATTYGALSNTYNNNNSQLNQQPAPLDWRCGCMLCHSDKAVYVTTS